MRSPAEVVDRAFLDRSSQSEHQLPVNLLTHVAMPRYRIAPPGELERQGIDPKLPRHERAVELESARRLADARQAAARTCPLEPGNTFYATDSRSTSQPGNTSTAG